MANNDVLASVVLKLSRRKGKEPSHWEKGLALTDDLEVLTQVFAVAKFNKLLCRLQSWRLALAGLDFLRLPKQTYNLACPSIDSARPTRFGHSPKLGSATSEVPTNLQRQKLPQTLRNDHVIHDQRSREQSRLGSIRESIWSRRAVFSIYHHIPFAAVWEDLQPANEDHSVWGVKKCISWQLHSSPFHSKKV